MTPGRARWSRAALSAGFAAAYGLGALVSGNQNSYLLHAFARLGPAALGHDWMTGTRDPFPVFTAVMAPLLSWSAAAALGAGHLALIALYAYALTGIAEQTFG